MARRLVKWFALIGNVDLSAMSLPSSERRFLGGKPIGLDARISSLQSCPFVTKLILTPDTSFLAGNRVPNRVPAGWGAVLL